MQILSGMWITVISFLALLSSAESQLAAPINLNVSNQGVDGFTLTLDPVTSAYGYRLTAVARYDSSDTVTINGSTSIMVVGRRSNIIYDVSVQAFSADDVLGAVAAIFTRTAPNGIGIRSVITTPTFITIFLEPVPGVTAHEVEVKSTSTSVVISPTDFGLSHVAIATGLNPNTNYSIRARAAEAGGMTFNVSQSPFGSSYHAVTDMASMFASVVLEEHAFNNSLPTDTTFTSTVENDLLTSHQAISRSVFSISIVNKVSNSSEYDCENGTGGKTRCFYEILVTDQTLPSNLPALSDGTKYSESVIRYNASGVGYYDYFVQANQASLNFASNGLCTNPNIAADYRLWSLYNGTDFVKDIPLDSFTGDGSARSELTVAFNSSGVIFDPIASNEDFLMLNGNVIYGFKQNYLIKVCHDSSSTPDIHDRRYDSYNPFNNGSDAFTLLTTPEPLAMSSDLFSFNFYPNNTGATITFPPIMERAESYNITYNGVLYSLTVEDLDSSSHFKISTTPTAAAENITVLITGTVRQAKNTPASTPTTTITHTNECFTKTQSCDSNATCSNTIGSYSCVCNTGYTGNGTWCTDINECASNNTHNCDGNATCTNNAGSFDCNCNVGYTGNGTSCTDIDECTMNTDKCDGNSSHTKISTTSPDTAENITVSITGTVRQATNTLATIPTTTTTVTNNGGDSVTDPPPCDNRTDDLVCSSENLGELCVPDSVCQFGNSDNSRVKYDCACLVNRNNTCGGTQSITVSCDVDYCRHTDACSSHTDSVCFEDGNLESGDGYECRCQAGYFYSEDKNCHRPGGNGIYTLAFIPPLLVLTAVARLAFS